VGGRENGGIWIGSVLVQHKRPFWSCLKDSLRSGGKSS
jgi:hypothetical protein